ncbi:MAG: serine/threonine-protein phosphatase [Kofleriaceae bacterium]|nr:MAG: serine/threonine-protein phosphatase [Kofleriaceae bacterium]MBZ0232070.1 protein phosphatase 2C domain-containing protein [Kofleriaceae bacterium]
MAADIKMRVSARTDVGRVRTTNEDGLAVNDLASGEQIDVTVGDRDVDVKERGVLLALSDGMGGHQAGEIASALVLESLQQAMQQETMGPIHQQLDEAVQRANLTVMNAARADNRRGMGATLTAVFVRGAEAYIAEVGDSRAYLLRNGRLRQITRDQSLVQLMVDHGVMSPEEAKRSASKNVILQAMGLAPDVRVAIARLELRRKDRFLLCSDGVTNEVSDDELKETLTGSQPRAACDTMIALANERGGRDNSTVIVADLTGEGLDLPDEFETVTETYEVLKAFEASLGSGAAAAPPVNVPMSPAIEALPDLPGDLPEDPPLPPPSTAEAAGETQKLPRAKGPTWSTVAIVAFVLVALLVLMIVLTS